MALAAGVDMALVTGGVDEQHRVLEELTRARSNGELEQNTLERSRNRIRKLAAAFPSKGDRSADLAHRLQRLKRDSAPYLERAASEGLVSLGELPLLDPDERVLVVTSGPARESAATQSTVDPGKEFAEELRQAGVDVRLLRIDPASPPSMRVVLEEAGMDFSACLFVSTGRTRLKGPLVRLAADLTDAAPSYVHVALWNPYSVELLPGPALLTFGWRKASLQAAVRTLLTGGTAPGRSPIPITTAGGQRTLKGR